VPSGNLSGPAVSSTGGTVDQKYRPQVCRAGS
jgi:hypothetical protein